MAQVRARSPCTLHIDRKEVRQRERKRETLHAAKENEDENEKKMRAQK